jgi:hypothetical protein
MHESAGLRRGSGSGGARPPGARRAAPRGRALQSSGTHPGGAFETLKLTRRNSWLSSPPAARTEAILRERAWPRPLGTRKDGRARVWATPCIEKRDRSIADARTRRARAREVMSRMLGRIAGVWGVQGCGGCCASQMRLSLMRKSVRQGWTRMGFESRRWQWWHSSACHIDWHAAAEPCAPHPAVGWGRTPASSDCIPCRQPACLPFARARAAVPRAKGKLCCVRWVRGPCARRPPWVAPPQPGSVRLRVFCCPNEHDHAGPCRRGLSGTCGPAP